MNLPRYAVPALVAAAMLSATGCTNDLRTPPGDPTDADSLTSAPAVTDEARRSTQQLPNTTQMLELTLPQGSRPGADLLSDAMLDFGLWGKELLRAAALWTLVTGEAQVDQRFWEAGLIPTRPVSEAGAVLPWKNGPSSSTPAAIHWWTDAQGLWFDSQATRFIDATAPRTTGFYSWDTIANASQQRVFSLPAGPAYDYARQQRTSTPTTPSQIATAISEYWQQSMESRILDYVREAGSLPTDLDQLFAAQGVALMPSTIEPSALGVVSNTGAAGDPVLVLQYDPALSQIALIRWSPTGHHVGRVLRLTSTTDGTTASFHAMREVGSLDLALVYRAWRVPGSL